MHRVTKFAPWRKYGNKKTEVNGISYDSKLEAKVGWELELRKKAGEIQEIERQVTFPLVVNDLKICSYRADFVVTYPDGLKEVVEAKGMMLPVSAIKMKLFEALYPEYKLNIVKY